ncbi:MAG: hypothetical protein GXP08_16825 [Gammaproteobacteria bacterium]|nr:hypothetical protein [Gammaproteobacteria bacterium]
MNKEIRLITASFSINKLADFAASANGQDQQQQVVLTTLSLAASLCALHKRKVITTITRVVPRLRPRTYNEK